MSSGIARSGFARSVTPMLLTLNEEDNLPRTLAALDWATTIVVIDSGSTDRTLNILAANPRVKTLYRAFDTHADQGNFGLDQVETEWVLSLDADYVLSDDLQREICALQPDEAQSGYRANFVYCVFGKALRSTLYPARTVLYRRERARYRNDGHTQRVMVNGKVSDLVARIHHDDRKPLSRWFRSQIAYARMEAEHLVRAEPHTLKRIDRLRQWGWPAPFVMLVYTLLWRRYLLAGRAGLYYSFQRVLAELMLAIEINDRRVRHTCDRDDPQGPVTVGRKGGGS